MIVDEHMVISIDIPRTASSARARLFAGVPIDDSESTPAVQAMQAKYWSAIGKHASARYYLRRSPIKFITYFKFTFVRNPWDRMVSFFHYRKRKFGADDFELYIIENKFNDLNSQQLDYITFFRRKCLVDFVGRFEKLNHDFDKICEIVGFPHRLPYEPWKLSRDYTSNYNDVTRKIVAQCFHKDIDHFKYKFGE